MKFQKFTELLDGEPAHIAFLSTFQFDPDFFERRVLNSPALSKARRIAVFIDASQWNDLLRHEVLARHLNRRYLVVPVNHSSGVFHPKLSLIVRENGAQVLCGSNNLTRSGCSSNLELLNSLSFNFDQANATELDLAKDAFKFFETASLNVDDGIRRILKEWLLETAESHSWIKEPTNAVNASPKLLHTYSGSIWERLVDVIDPVRPKELFIISPFHDSDAGIAKRLCRKWPNASVEFLVQQGYTNLPVRHFQKLSKAKLSEMQISSRRVHAKLIAWKSAKGAGCLVGSANFTSAALDSRNVEACLLYQDADKLVEALFDRQLDRQPINFEDFEPGINENPEDNKSDLSGLRITSAIITDQAQLAVNYTIKLNGKIGFLRLDIRTPNELRPRFSTRLPNRVTGSAVISLPENVLADIPGTILASLAAEVHGDMVESIPVWVIQEKYLTFTPGESPSSSKNMVEETGEGLPEYIDELGKNSGIQAVIDYLGHLNIRFYDGAGNGPGLRKFRLRIRDPYQPDVAPEWLLDIGADSSNLELAIYDFVDRHEKTRLLRHATRGNINGIENFIDIFKSLIRLLYVYCKRGVVKNPRLVGYLCKFLKLSTLGQHTEEGSFEGYLVSVYENVDHDRKLLGTVCTETNFAAEIRSALLIAQRFRFFFTDNVKASLKPKRPREVLPSYAGIVEASFRKCGIAEPKLEDIRRSLEGYQMFTDGEISLLLKELPDKSAKGL